MVQQYIKCQNYTIIIYSSLIPELNFYSFKDLSILHKIIEQVWTNQENLVNKFTFTKKVQNSSLLKLILLHSIEVKKISW